MIHTDHRFHEAVERAVGAIEARTDAEVVVVAAARSATYDDLRARFASAVSLVWLLILLVIPWEVGPFALLLELAAAWFGAHWLAGQRPVLAALVRRSRATREVQHAAAVAFVEEAVHGTPHRTGVLVYISALEGKVELVCDLGVQGAVPRGELASCLADFSHADLDHFLHGLTTLGDVLAARLPHHEGSDATNLPNAPRIRP